MSYLVDGYHRESAAMALPSARMQFIRRTYLHLLGAVVAFVAASAALIGTGVAESILLEVFGNQFAWLMLMVLFIGGTFAAQYMARSRMSVGVQYAGLALYVSLYTLLFVPILTVASNPKFGGTPELPIQAGIVTLAVFIGLTAAVFVTGKDFSFLGPILMVGSFLGLGMIIAAVFFGFNWPLVICGFMVALFAGYIIYDTSNVLHHYSTNEHVAASMALFGSAAMLFYYILLLFMSARNDR
jgi:FtsH-binding integral membrane protein